MLNVKKGNTALTPGDYSPILSNFWSYFYSSFKSFGILKMLTDHDISIGFVCRIGFFFWSGFCHERSSIYFLLSFPPFLGRKRPRSSNKRMFLKELDVHCESYNSFLLLSKNFRYHQKLFQKFKCTLCLIDTSMTIEVAVTFSITVRSTIASN